MKGGGMVAADGTPRVGGEDIRSRTSAHRLSGTPPRRRGGPTGISLHQQGRRNTPASAGRTEASERSPWPSTEHPRVGGEDLDMWAELVEKYGTLPRRRGGRGAGEGQLADLRNTPASAGRTPCPPGGSGCTSEHPRVGGEDPPGHHGGARPPEHPRVGGEDNESDVKPIRIAGTPPRRRGGQDERGGDQEERRNTPASAGRTGRPRSRTGCRPEHPRVGGEDRCTPYATRRATGTPPRRRGGRGRPRVPDHPGRKTPASAGRTPRPARAGRRRTEHPRVGGEDSGIAAAEAGTGGTPPRRRGGRGNPPGPLPTTRNTPASAGRTPPSWRWRAPRSEHPRVGGEDARPRLTRLRSSGTPPRRRG